MRAAVLFFLFTSLGISTLNGQDTSALLIELPASYSGLHFVNDVIELPDRNIGTYDYMYNGGGVAIGDLNNDGLADLVFTGSDVPDKIYQNLGSLKFRDVTISAGLPEANNGWSTGVSLCDINGDGLLDIYICRSGPDYKDSSTKNVCYINLGDMQFREAGGEIGIADPGLSTQAVFFDADLDGDDDLFVLNHGVRNWANQSFEWLEAVRDFGPEERSRFTSSFYLNEAGSFRKINAGFDVPTFGLGVLLSDFNEDGRPDLFVANDYFIPDRLYLNQPSAQVSFADRAKQYFDYTSFFSMGCDAADMNNDGTQDLLVLDMTPADHFRNKTNMASMDVREFRFLSKGMEFLPQYMFNSFWLNQQNDKMLEVGQTAGLSSSDWSWAPLLADFDNDGLRDVYITNGILRDIKNNDWRKELLSLMRQSMDARRYFDHLKNAPSNPLANPLYLNQDGLHFEQVAIESSRPTFSNGAAYGDLDNDGDLDIVVNNLKSEAVLLENQSNNTNWIRFDLSGLDGLATVEVETSKRTLWGNNHFTRGYQSCHEPIVHFGLDRDSVLSVRLHLGDKGSFEFGPLESGKIHKLSRAMANEVAHAKQEVIFETPQQPSLLRQFRHYHLENEFNEFASGKLIPHSQSRSGPGVAFADFDRDGKADFFIGGAAGFPATLKCTSGCRFKAESTQHTENNGALAFDADADGDIDIYLANGGGAEFSQMASETGSSLEDRLLLNEGADQNGVVQFTEQDLPEMNASTKVIAPFDWDKDGDLDLFVGGRNSPGQYPAAPQSFWLENEAGKFKLVSSEILGMVTDAKWFDWNEDGKMDLVVVGEWMPLTVMLANGNSYERTTPIPNSAGWWQSISVVDYDKDGLQDLLLGNLGNNNKFKPQPEKPLHLYAGDLDQNGRVDLVLGKELATAGNTVYPTRGFQCSAEQVPDLSDKIPSFNDFASASLTEIYPQEQLEAALHLTADRFESMLLRNKGSGDYEEIALPKEAQLIPIKASLVSDFDRDGHPDIVIAGGIIETEPETQPYAGTAMLLTGSESGFRFEAFIPALGSAVVDLQLVDLEGETILLSVQNNGPVKAVLVRSE